MRFAVRLLISAAALWVATRLVPGVTYTGGWIPFLGVALVFGVVNAFVRPVAWVLTFPVVILTLGLFLLVINGCMLWLTSALSDALGLGFRVEGFWAAFWGALVVSIVSGMLSLMLRADRQVTRRTIDVRAR
jgi:putative membrane protein